MATPAVSVLITCFNLGRYLDEAVDSVLAQTFQDFEIVIVNDGSTDPATTALLADYRRRRTRVIVTEHRGLATARNLAIAETSGRYLCALDADDRLASTYFGKAVRILDDDPSIAFVSSWLEMFGDETGLWKQDACDLPTLLAEDTVHTAALVRRSVVAEVGGYDGAMGAQGDEDWDLWLGIVERGYRGVILPEVLFHYRRRAGSMGYACTEGPTHLRLLRYMVGKHEASFRLHLFELLLRKEAESCDLLKRTYALDRHLGTWLVPLVERRRGELARLLAKLAPADGGPRETPTPEGPEPEPAAEHALRKVLEARLRAAEHEVQALRASRSWKITAPLRRADDFWRRLRNR